MKVHTSQLNKRKHIITKNKIMKEIKHNINF